MELNTPPKIPVSVDITELIPLIVVEIKFEMFVNTPVTMLCTALKIPVTVPIMVPITCTIAAIIFAINVTIGEIIAIINDITIPI